MKKIKMALMSLWAMVTGWFLAFPADLYTVWNVMPDDIKTAIGPQAARVIGIILLAGAFIRSMSTIKKENKDLKNKVESMETKDENNN
jgi:hypothetical protein